MVVWLGDVWLSDKLSKECGILLLKCSNVLLECSMSINDKIVRHDRIENTGGIF